VPAVLAVPLAFVAWLSQQGPVLIVHQDELLDAVEGGSKKLAASQIDRCAKALDMLRQSAGERKRVRSHFVDLTHHEVKFRPDRSQIGF
jgi:hypothetical protein